MMRRGERFKVVRDQEYELNQLGAESPPDQPVAPPKRG
jgi:hypothetical protein